jgi:hypothetical protein
MDTFTVLKSSLKFGLLLQFSSKLPKVNNRPMGENSPNLATLFVAIFAVFGRKLTLALLCYENCQTLSLISI